MPKIHDAVNAAITALKCQKDERGLYIGFFGPVTVSLRDVDAFKNDPKVVRAGDYYLFYGTALKVENSESDSVSLPDGRKLAI